MFSFFPQSSAQSGAERRSDALAELATVTCAQSEMRGRGILRGTTEGNRGITVDATMRFNRSVKPAHELLERGSHTLQTRHFEQPDALHARLIEATVEAIAEGSAPRLSRSRLWL
jgi:hypothetical protein